MDHPTAPRKRRSRRSARESGAASSTRQARPSHRRWRRRRDSRELFLAATILLPLPSTPGPSTLWSGSTLDSALCQSFDEATLQREEDDDDGENHHDGRRAGHGPVATEARGEVVIAGDDREELLLGQEDCR